MTTRTECIQIYVLRLVPFADAYYAFFVPVNIQQVLSCLLRYILPERFLVYRVQRAMSIKMFNKCWKMFQRVRRMAKNKNKKGFHCGEAGRKRVKSEISAIFNFVGFVSPKHCAFIASEGLESSVYSVIISRGDGESCLLREKRRTHKSNEKRANGREKFAPRPKLIASVFPSINCCCQIGDGGRSEKNEKSFAF